MDGRKQLPVNPWLPVMFSLLHFVSTQMMLPNGKKSFQYSLYHKTYICKKLDVFVKP